MLSKIAGFITALLSLVFCGVLLSCAPNKAPLQIQNSLPQEKIAYYNDSFEKMREDLWERAGYVYRREQVQNFRQADLLFGKNKLIIRTKTGSFSKGGLGSKFALRGDFDIQLYSRIDFIKDITVWEDKILPAHMRKALITTIKQAKIKYKSVIADADVEPRK